VSAAPAPEPAPSAESPRSAEEGPRVEETFLAFARALRAGGVQADPQRVQGFLEAGAHLDVLCARDVYWAGRHTLCSTARDIARYDACFAFFFGPMPTVRTEAPAPVTVVRPAMWQPERPPAGPEEQEAPADSAASASEIEVLRSRDIAHLDAEERAEVARLLALISTRRPMRRTRRSAPARRGRIDLGRTLRGVARTDGEPLRLHRRARTVRPRPVVMLVDISGSMSPYADALLRLAHAIVRGHPRHTEVFSVGTRLTRLTRELRHADPETAMAAAGAAIPDWSGGTRLGAELNAFLDRHGQRGMARGALAVIASDGWERGDAALLGTQMARLGRLTRRVVWANPHRGKPGYEPLTAGMTAALPHIDDFVAGHSLAALERLAEAIISGGEHRIAGGEHRIAGDTKGGSRA
jgi:uncharacterized protein